VGYLEFKFGNTWKARYLIYQGKAGMDAGRFLAAGKQAGFILNADNAQLDFEQPRLQSLDPQKNSEFNK